jgi:assimilatory nitrate reductase catalytic subunit
MGAHAPADQTGHRCALANGLLHVLIRDGLVDRDFIDSRTEHFEDARRVAMSYWPDRVEQITGITEKLLVETAHALGRAPSAMVLTARGPEQQAQGVTNALAYINLALAIGAVGKPASGFGTLTGQGNGQGGREHGQKADQLPGYRRLDDPRDREHVARCGMFPAADLPTSGKSAYEILDSLGSTIHALVVIASNPVVSAPNALHIVRRLSALDTLIVSDFFRSETVEHADVVFPAAQWAEEAGTMTNLEGRVVLRKRAVLPPEGVKTDVDIIAGWRRDSAKGNGSSTAATKTCSTSSAARQRERQRITRASRGGASKMSRGSSGPVRRRQSFRHAASVRRCLSHTVGPRAVPRDAARRYR